MVRFRLPQPDRKLFLPIQRWQFILTIKIPELVDHQATIPLIKKKIPIIKDEAIDIKFGTGALKFTPAHDILDFEIGQRHQTAACTDY